MSTTTTRTTTAPTTTTARPAPRLAHTGETARP